MQVLGAIFLASCSLFMQHAPLFLLEREWARMGEWLCV
jgi:hypothetical protein